jgi:alpha-glucosidase
MMSWWQSGVIYQVYPRSFQDSGGDGVGDLEGIRRRLPYLATLGVDAIWLSPIFVSPMADFGYDIADYEAIDPLFGTMADFDRLLFEAHCQGLKLLLDFVPNHTSNRHPWFVASRSSRTDPKRDWYLWCDPAPGGGPPNNWVSNFAGSAWEWDPATSQYYLHSFLKEQPDLNWRNPDVVAAMLDVLRFWFAKGVDGFRIDVLWLIVKDAAFRDNPPNPDWQPGKPDIDRFLQLHNVNQPEVHDLIAQIRAVADGYGERLLIGEIYLPLSQLVTYYGPEGRGVQLPFNFQLITASWSPEAIGKIIADYEAALPPGGWPNWVLGNHDQPRIAARVGTAQARIAAMLLLTLRGTPTFYYGDELGLAAQSIPPGRVRDPQALRAPGVSFNRDEARTSMPWSAAPHAGFSTVEPWLPVDADFAERNVEAEAARPDSMLALVRALLALRRREDVLQVGAWRPVPMSPPILAYERHDHQDRIAVLLNFSGDVADLDLPSDLVGAEILLAARHKEVPSRLAATLRLDGDQGLIVRVAGGRP